MTTDRWIVCLFLLLGCWMAGWSKAAWGHAVNCIIKHVWVKITAPRSRYVTELWNWLEFLKYWHWIRMDIVLYRRVAHGGLKRKEKKINNCKTVSISFMCRLPTLMIFGDVLVWRTAWPFLQVIYGQAHKHFYGPAVKCSWMAKWDSHWPGREPANKYKNTMFSLLTSGCPAFGGFCWLLQLFNIHTKSHQQELL